MANFFLDTSALAKLYHAEAGSDYVERLLQQPGNRLLISRLCLVEMESVFAIKVRSGDLNSVGLEIARRRLRADLSQRRVLSAHRLRKDTSAARGACWRIMV